jgi:long-chain acyl-CoA synthetase
MLETASARKTVCYLPWSHIFGLTCSLHTCLASGASMALVPRREAVLSSVELVQPSELSSVPLLLNKIYAGVLSKVADQSSLKQSLFHKAFAVARERNALVEANEPVGVWLDWKFRVVDRVVMSKVRAKLLGGKIEFFSAGGGKASMQVLQFFEDVGVPICEGYGMTEAAPVITMSKSPGFERRRLGSVGKPLLGVDVCIRNPDTLELLAIGKEGEVCVSGAVLASGYYKNEKATAETFLFDEKEKYRYLRTGDLGHLDAEGFLTISGRIKEQYKLQNGKFVSPAPVEDYLGRSVYINQVAVFGDHQEYNVALIVPDLPELQKWAEHHRGGAGIPAFPASSEGKLAFASGEGDAFLESPAVIDLITSDLRKYAVDLKRYEYVQTWVFLKEPFSAENDMLTQKMSMKRHNVSKVYAELLSKIYRGEIGNQVSYK